MQIMTMLYYGRRIVLTFIELRTSGGRNGKFPRRGDIMNDI